MLGDLGSVFTFFNPSAGTVGAQIRADRLSCQRQGGRYIQRIGSRPAQCKIRQAVIPAGYTGPLDRFGRPCPYRHIANESGITKQYLSKDGRCVSVFEPWSSGDGGGE